MANRGSNLYFTSDTHRIYRGSDVYATNSFETVSASTATFENLVVTGDVSMSLSQVEFGSICATDIVVDGSSVAVVGHLHSIPDISGLSSILSGITEASMSKNQVSANAGTFDNITADVGNFRLISVSGSENAITVNGTNVSLEGHTHSMADVTGLASAIQAIELSISGIPLANTLLSGQTMPSTPT